MKQVNQISHNAQQMKLESKQQEPEQPKSDKQESVEKNSEKEKSEESDDSSSEDENDDKKLFDIVSPGMTFTENARNLMKGPSKKNATN